MNDFVITYHANCPDGWGSAYWLSKHIPEVRLKGSGYTNIPSREEVVSLYAERDVMFVDFCYPAETMELIGEVARDVLVLDHHQTSRPWLESAGYNIYPSVDAWSLTLPNPTFKEAVHNEKRSGIGLAADFVKAIYGVEAPDWFRHVEDRDLWNFSLKGTAEVLSYVMSHEYTVEDWDHLASMDSYQMYDLGKAIDRYRNKQISEVVKSARKASVAGHSDIWLVECPYMIASDVAGELAKRDPTRFAAYRVIYADRIQYGLRSTPEGMDVAEVAAAFAGGGGHKHASGFSIPKLPSTTTN